MINKLFKLNMLIILLLCPITTVLAVRATNDIVTVLQPDGTRLDVLIHGDEWANYMTTLTGEVIVKNLNGYYEPCKNPEYEINRKLLYRQKKISRRILNTGDVPTTGTLRGLVILVEFADMQFSKANDIDKFNRQLNEVGYNDDGATGSVSDYFICQSGGLFTPQFDVVGPVKLSNVMSYYGADLNGITDANCYRMIEESCKLAEDLDVDFSLYDNNSDGEVDLVYIIYSGYAQSNGAGPNTIWPHMWYLTEDFVDLKLDGVKINRYACSSEKSGISGDAISGIGLFCHEFSHTLGLPDLYDLTSTSNKIMFGAWSVMDSGCYNNSMHTPAGYSSFEKVYLNWIEPELLTDKQKNVELPSINKGKCFKIISPSNQNECYYFETRLQSDMWDAYLPSEGMIISYVNFDKDIWNNNQVNTKDNWRMHIVPANNDFSKSTNVTSVPFPGTKNKTFFTDITSPSLSFSEDVNINLPISNISFDGEVVSFDIGYNLDKPVLADPSNISDNSVRINWGKVNDADYYMLKIISMSTGEIKTYDKIFKSYYTLSNLSVDETYSVSVKALNENLTSEFSDEQIVNLTSLKIDSISAVYANDKIYTIDGLFVGSDISSLQRGVYIVVSNEKSKMILIK